MAILGATWLLLFSQPGLRDLPMQLWDESRQGVSALEMLRSGQWLVTTNNGEPDLWNTKPPLLIWLQALSVQLLGPTELAVRLPTALTALATALVVAAAARRWLGGAWPGLVAALVLLTAPGYLRDHVVLTGDYDGLLTLWTTLLALQWFWYAEQGCPRDAYLSALWALLAVLTKGVAGALLLPGLLLFTILSGATSRLGRPAVWLAVLLAAVGVAGWYGLREALAPGYWQAVWENELGGRAFSALEGHAHSRFWYFERLWRHQYAWWLLPTAAGWALGLRPPRRTVRWRLALLSLVVPLSHLAIISAASTKLEWYDAPIYPLLALSVAVLAAELRRRFLPAAPAWALTAGMLVLAAAPLYGRLRFIGTLPTLGRDEAPLFIGDHLRVQQQRLPALRDFALAHPGYHGTLDFYRLATERRHGGWLTAAYPEQIGQQPAGQTVVVCGRRLRRQWEQQWRTQVLLETDSCATLRLEQRR
ncbi:hypothetical protein GCM10027048_34410 [Hymenobacter coalescens]